MAEGKLPRELVRLHWFTQRGTDGSTEVTSADLDPAGAFGDWPEDFAAVDLGAQSAYLDASGPSSSTWPQTEPQPEPP